MILDDLRRFRASPEVPRLAVALCVTAAVMLFALASTSLPNPDIAAPQASTATFQTGPSQEGVGQGALAAAAPLGCTKLYRGQWLRVEVWQQRKNADGSGGEYEISCFYGYGPQWEAL